jgi:hypothetical protein
MRFTRRPLILPKGITPRRLSAARRRLQRHRDAWALFPEYWPAQTPEQDILEGDARHLALQVNARHARARRWREIRARVRAHPQREQILRYWNVCHYPGDPDTLAGLLSTLDRDPQHLTRQEQAIERARCMGRIMQAALSEVDAARPGESDRDAFYRRLASARQIAIAQRPDLFQPTPSLP